MKFTVVGLGYVGLSLATLISQKYEVVAIDVVREKVEMVNSKRSPIVDKEITEFLTGHGLKLTATDDYSKCADSDYVIIATPTNYDPETKSSRPIRKYLGTEDPETGELIPSSGTRGRKPASETKPVKKEESEYRSLVESLRKENAEKDARIKKLEQQNMILRSNLERIRSMIENILKE